MEALRYLATERAIVGRADRAWSRCAPDELAERVAAHGRPAQGRRARARAGRAASRCRRPAGNLTEQARDVNGVDLPRPRRRRRRGADDLRTHGARPARPARHRAPQRRRRSPARPRAGRSSSWPPTSRRAQRGIRAGELVRVAATALGGGGGGKDDIAQGGGRTRPRSARRSRRSSGASGSSPADAGLPRARCAPRRRRGHRCASGSPLSDPDGILATPVATRGPRPPRASRRRATPTSRRSPRWCSEHAAVGWSSGCPDRSPVTKGPPRRGRASMLPWLAARIAPVWVRLVDERLTRSMRTARSVRAGSPAGGSAPWSTRLPPCSSCRPPSTRSAAPAPLPGSRSDEDGASRGRRTRGRDPAARRHRDDLR